MRGRLALSVVGLMLTLAGLVLGVVAAARGELSSAEMISGAAVVALVVAVCVSGIRTRSRLLSRERDKRQARAGPKRESQCETREVLPAGIVLRSTGGLCELRSTVGYCELRSTVGYCELRSTVGYCELRSTVGLGGQASRLPGAARCLLHQSRRRSHYPALLPAAWTSSNCSIVGRVSETVAAWSLVALLLGLALTLSSRDLIGMALSSSQNVDCYFDQSCDELPGYRLGQHLLAVGWRVVSGAAIALSASIGALVLSRSLRGRHPFDTGRPQD